MLQRAVAMHQAAPGIEVIVFRFQGRVLSK